MMMQYPQMNGGTDSLEQFVNQQVPPYSQTPPVKNHRSSTTKSHPVKERKDKIHRRAKSGGSYANKKGEMQGNNKSPPRWKR